MTETPVTETDAPDDPIALPPRRSNRPVTLGHRIEYAAFLALYGFFRVLGVDAASMLAGKTMRFAGPLIRPVSKRAEANLALIFPDWSEAQRRAVLRDAWENLGRLAAEFAHLDALRAQGPAPRVTVVGEDILRRHAGAAIFVSSHSANWEVTPATLQALGVDNAFIYRAANNPLTDEFIIKRRAEVMSRRQIPKGARDGKAIVSVLQAGRVLLMLADQRLNSGIEAAFLGKPAMTASAPARLALKYDAPIIPVALERLKGARFRMTVNAPVAFTPTGDRRADIAALTQRVNDAIGEAILARPGEWLWFHRRWKMKKKL